MLVELQQSLVFTSDHIKCVANSQHYLKHLRTDLFHGSHTVTSRNELISIDRNHNISKYSGDMNNSCLMLRSKEFDWKPTAVYWSRITGDLLVGMHSSKSYPTGKIIRYHGGVQPVNTIPRSQREHLFSYPTHITENTNVISWFLIIVLSFGQALYYQQIVGDSDGSPTKDIHREQNCCHKEFVLTHCQILFCVMNGQTLYR